MYSVPELPRRGFKEALDAAVNVLLAVAFLMLSIGLFELVWHL